MDPREDLPEPAAVTYTPSEALTAYEQDLASEALARRRQYATVPEVIGDAAHSRGGIELRRIVAGRRGSAPRDRRTRPGRPGTVQIAGAGQRVGRDRGAAPMSLIVHVRILYDGKEVSLWRVKVVRFVAELLGVPLTPRGDFELAPPKR